MIHLPARLEVCSICNAHGHFVFSDGVRSQEFGFRLHGLAMLQEAVAADMIMVVESGVVREQISTSQIPYDHTSAKSSILWGIELYNAKFYMAALQDRRLNLTEQQIHDELVDTREREVPPDFISALNAQFGIAPSVSTSTH